MDEGPQTDSAERVSEQVYREPGEKVNRDCSKCGSAYLDEDEDGIKVRIRTIVCKEIISR